MTIEANHIVIDFAKCSVENMIIETTASDQNIGEYFKQVAYIDRDRYELSSTEGETFITKFVYKNCLGVQLKISVT